MKWALYDALFALTFPFLLPGFLLRMIRRGGYAARMGDRFALYPTEILRRFVPDGKPVCPHGVRPLATREANAPVWIHAVSVGEVQVAGQLMREWRKVEPEVRFCFSTTSSTGWRMAEREVTAADTLIYNPLDFPNFVKSALKTVRPRAIVLTESEIWPVFIRRAHKMGIPLFLINARVSDRSAPRYRRARFLFKDVFGCFTRIFAQSELDRERLVAAGAPEERVMVTGSFKFDVARRNPAKEGELAKWLGLAADPAAKRPRILLGGSTWPGEDKVLLDLYRDLLLHRDLFLPDPMLVIAPRHFEKADAVEANIRAAGFACVRRSLGDPVPTEGLGDAPFPVYLADTTGELMGLYALADMVFVGKTLFERGGQNMIEPCLCGKPTVVGPHTENFRPVMSDLLETDAIIQVRDEAGLQEAVLSTFYAPGELGARAAAAVARRQGVVPACVAEIREVLG